MKYFLFVVLSFTSFSYPEQPVVIGKLYGQLGNQFFQIAAAVSLALDNNAKAIFPDLKTETLYNIPITYAHVFQRLDASSAIQPINTIYKEPFFHFSPIPYAPNMTISGYFQSEKYFKHHKEEILSLLQPSEEIKSYLYSKYKDIIDHPKTVSVHIRMYKDTKPEFHPFVGWDYILKAINSFDSDSLFIVFSDQIAFCKRKLQKIIQNKNILFIEGNAHFHDLYLMSLCKNNIISNSSFSWWGAYLNQNKEKVVICPSPKKWFGMKNLGPDSKNLDAKDLLPSEWIILEHNNLF